MPTDKEIEALEQYIDEQIAAHRREHGKPFTGSVDSPIEALQKVKTKLAALTAAEQVHASEGVEADAFVIRRWMETKLFVR